MAKYHLIVDTETHISKRIDIFVYCDKRLHCRYAVENKKIAVGSGCTSLAEQLITCSFNEHMPIEVDVKQLDGGSGIEATWARHYDILK